MNVSHQTDLVKGRFPAERFLALMRDHGLHTRAAIARELGVSRQTVERWIRNERYPQGRMIARMQERFGDEEVLAIWMPRPHS